MSWRICTIAMMCLTWLIRRFPARESRCRSCAPEEASNGAAPFPGREVGPGREPGHVGDVDQDPGCAGRAHPVQVHQMAAAAGHTRAEFGVDGLELRVGGGQVGQQVRGDPPPRRAGHVARPDRGEHGLGLGGGRVLRRPPGTSSVSSRCSRFTVATRVRDSSSRRSVTSRNGPGHRPRGAARAGSAYGARQPRSSGRRAHRSSGPARCPHPDPGSQLRRHIPHLLPVDEQPLRQRSARALSALDRPHPVLARGGPARAGCPGPPGAAGHRVRP